MPLVNSSMLTLAERRNLVMRNPAPNPGFETSRTLVAAYQMILPGEHAPSHRHSSHALRVIIDGKGSYSIVDGDKTPMETGDVVLTPGWCWHGHGHDGTNQPTGSTELMFRSRTFWNRCSSRNIRKSTKRLSASRKRRPIALRARTLRAVSTQPRRSRGLLRSARKTGSADNALNGPHRRSGSPPALKQGAIARRPTAYSTSLKDLREHGRPTTLRLEPRRYVRCARLASGRSPSHL